MIKRFTNGLNIWKGVRDGWKHVYEGVKWNVENGIEVCFWLDEWILGTRALKIYDSVTIPYLEVNLLVASYVTSDREWDFNQLMDLIPNLFFQRISGVVPPYHSHGLD